MTVGLGCNLCTCGVAALFKARRAICVRIWGAIPEAVPGSLVDTVGVRTGNVRRNTPGGTGGATVGLYVTDGEATAGFKTAIFFC